MKHPEPMLWQQLLAGELKWPTRLWLKIHLWHCAECRRRVEEEQRDLELLREFRQGIELMATIDEVAEHQTSLPKEPHYDI